MTIETRTLQNGLGTTLGRNASTKSFVVENRRVAIVEVWHFSSLMNLVEVRLIESRTTKPIATSTATSSSGTR